MDSEFERGAQMLTDGRSNTDTGAGKSVDLVVDRWIKKAFLKVLFLKNIYQLG